LNTKKSITPHLIGVNPKKNFKEMNTNLLKEAIAEADAIKKMAIENAKASLNEAFDSKVKAMLAARLSEEADELEEEYDEEMDPDKEKMEEKKHQEEPEESEENDGDDEGYGMEEGDDTENEMPSEDGADEAFSLDAILAELEKDEAKDDKEVMEEEEDGDDMEDGKMKEAKKDKEDGEDEEEEVEPVDEEIDIAALLAEMENDNEEEGEEKPVKEEEFDDESYVAEGDDKGMLLSILIPILRKLKVSEDEIKKIQAGAQDIATAMANAKGLGEEKKKDAEVEEIKEIKRQAAELAQKVNETNLINAKLLYLNKILRKYNLSEQQKLKVISAFDKAGTTREAKIVHESLDQAFSVKNDNTKGNLKESIGFASKAAGNSTKRVINEGVIADVDTQVSRWQKLAGIIK
jgi:hypothetical protein